MDESGWDSLEGVGSTFHFNVRLGSGTSRTEQGSRENGTVAETRSVLVVDDNDTNCRILRSVLQKRGFRTSVAASGVAGLDTLQRAAGNGNPFDVVFVDAHMPGMDGFTLARRIKADPRFSGVRIAMLISSAQRGAAQLCQDLQVSACLTKPVGEAELTAAIEQIWTPTSKISQRTRPAERHGVRVGTATLHLLVVEDNPVNRLVLSRILEKENHTVKTAANGREALDMIAAERFDCVLMDVQMPVLNGFETVREIRNQERTSGSYLPVIAVTAHAVTGDLERCLGAGMDGYVTKPISEGRTGCH